MKKIVIIGGGIAGLSAGIHAQLYGFESIIYEKHSIVGGQCTGWDRQGYHVDGCIHWLTGTKEGSDLYEVWKTVGALGNVEIIQHDNFGTYEFDGASITLWQDLDRLQAELIAISPKDRDEILMLIQDIRNVQSMDMPAKMPIDMLPVKELLKLFKAMKGAGGVMNKTSKISCEEYAKRYQHPALRKMFETCMPSGYSIAAFIFGMGTFTSGNGAVPRGGSKEMALRMEKRYIELGGKVVTKISAEEILIHDKVATAVRFSNGITVNADYVIAACDVHITFEKLLKGIYHDKKFEIRYHNSTDYAIPTSVQIAFGVTADLGEYPPTVIFETASYRVGVSHYNTIGMKNYSFEESFAPKGNTIVTFSINQSDTDYKYWEKLYQNKDDYRKEKQRIATEVQSRLLERYPEFEGKIVLLDVATPMTYNRYTGAYHGAWMSFMMTPKSKSMMHSGKIKGLKNCYLTGQWLQPPGGLPVAVTTGKFTVQRICKREKLLYN